FERWVPRNLDASYKKKNLPALKLFFIGFFLVQIILPFRFLKYNSDLLWKEQGYRFSWRVMLMEKAGSITFRVKDNNSGREGIFDHQAYLTQLQEIQMATQPDMILDMAYHIKKIMKEQGHEDISVFAEGYVTLNGSGSKAFTKPEIDLLSLEDGYTNRSWIYDWK
ncbi:MAG: HTTM domain-containing protein, partial [Bacteroidota bacterium]